jgi:nucleotide-binding universal stress UspA family protein
LACIEEERAVLRSILVALDATAASAAAQRLALRLAKRFGSQITGIAVLDRGYLAAPTAVGIGGMAYKEHRDQVKLEEAKAFLARLESTFQKSCEETGAVWQVVEAEGKPHKLIEMESGRHDLLVIGKDTDFHFDYAASTSDTVQRLLKENPRPLLVCPERMRETGPIMAAYDGSLHASRALHMLILLGLADGSKVHVVSVASEKDRAEQRAAYATDLFVKHGIEAIPHGIGSSAAPAHVVAAEAQALGAAMVALGASGHNALQSWLLGSASRELLNACPCTLFVHH